MARRSEMARPASVEGGVSSAGGPAVGVVQGDLVVNGSGGPVMESLPAFASLVAERLPAPRPGAQFRVRKDK